MGLPRDLAALEAWERFLRSQRHRVLKERVDLDAGKVDEFRGWSQCQQSVLLPTQPTTPHPVASDGHVCPPGPPAG